MRTLRTIRSVPLPIERRLRGGRDGASEKAAGDRDQARLSAAGMVETGRVALMPITWVERNGFAVGGRGVA
jgi:hypothetical protein